MQSSTPHKRENSRWARWSTFLAGGLFNTLVTYLVYLLLQKFLNYQLAFLVAYCLGIGFAYYFNAQFVFRTHLSWRGLLCYPIVYLVQYALSAFCMKIFVERFHVPKAYGPLLTSAAVVPVTYVLSKLVIERVRAEESAGYANPEEE
jgi:putative flippase GtrA